MFSNANFQAPTLYQTRLLDGKPTWASPSGAKECSDASFPAVQLSA